VRGDVGTAEDQPHYQFFGGCVISHIDEQQVPGRQLRPNSPPKATLVICTTRAATRSAIASAGGTRAPSSISSVVGEGAQAEPQAAETFVGAAGSKSGRSAAG